MKSKPDTKKGYTALPSEPVTPMFLGKPNQIQKDRSIANPVASHKDAGKGTTLPAASKHGPFGPIAVPKMRSLVKKTKKGMK